MEKKLLLRSVNDVKSAAMEIIHSCKNHKIFAIYGEMGVGKTTLIKAICSHLGSDDNFSSPSFAIINEYKAGKPIYHADFYRLKKPEEALEIGIEEYLYNGNYCFIEWPELVENWLPEETVKIYMYMGNENERMITIQS